MAETFRCPICKRELASADAEWRPFCSPRCRSIDLGSWLSESYRVPAVSEEGEEDGEDDPGFDRGNETSEKEEN
jgi:hypothetical protein